MLLLWLFVALFVLRLLTYIYRAFRCAHLKKIYERWVSGEIPSIIPYEQDILELFDVAGAHDVYLSLEESRTKQVRDTFKRAAKSFARSIRRNFHLNYWLKTILFLPVKILDRIGRRNLPAVNKLKTISLVIYWALVAVDILRTFFVSIPFDEFLEFIALLIEKLF